jgi:hypothetical protein
MHALVLAILLCHDLPFIVFTPTEVHGVSKMQPHPQVERICRRTNGVNNRHRYAGRRYAVPGRHNRSGAKRLRHTEVGKRDRDYAHRSIR